MAAVARRIEAVEMSRAALIEAEGTAITFPVLATAFYHVTSKGKRGALVVYGGLCWRRFDPVSGRCWCEMFLVVKRPKLLPGNALVRHARRMVSIAAQMGEPVVFCVRDAKWPNSEKLLRLAGLAHRPDLRVFDDGEAQTGEIWTWQNSRLSQQS